MKQFILTVCALFASVTMFAQDIIVTKDAQKIEAKILEVSKTEIKYKEYNNLNGPTFILETKEISSIIYSNGKEVIYNANNGNDSGYQEFTSNEIGEGTDNIQEKTFIQSNYSLIDPDLQKKSIASVYRYTGIYIFNDNEPICEYTILGRVKASVSWSSEYEGVRNHLIKKVLKQFSDADAIILELSDGGTDRAAAIKFTNPQEKSKYGFSQVNSFNGLLIFSDCEPVNSYTIIGRSKSAVTWSGQYDAVKANLVKKAVKNYPDAQGIIINTKNGGVDRGVIITF